MGSLRNAGQVWRGASRSCCTTSTSCPWIESRCSQMVNSTCKPCAVRSPCPCRMVAPCRPSRCVCVPPRLPPPSNLPIRGVRVRATPRRCVRALNKSCLHIAMSCKQSRCHRCGSGRSLPALPSAQTSALCGLLSGGCAAGDDMMLGAEGAHAELAAGSVVCASTGLHGSVGEERQADDGAQAAHSQRGGKAGGGEAQPTTCSYPLASNPHRLPRCALGFCCFLSGLNKWETVR